MSKSPKEPQRQFRFSAERLATLPIPSDGPAIYYDRDVKQLGLRIQPTGNGVFFVLKKVCGRTYRKTLGDWKHLKLDATRKHAHKLLGDVAEWLAGDRQDLCPMLRPLDDAKLTFQAAFEMYIKSPRKRVTNRERAEKRSRYILNRYLTDIAGRSVEELTPTVIGILHEKLTKDFGAIAANRAHEVVRATFNHLIAKELWTTTNPSKGATRNPQEARTVILEPDEIKPFRDALAAEGNRDFAEFVALLLATGVRKKNLYEAEWREISFSLKVWTIPGEKMKNGKTTALTLKPEAIRLFKMRKDRQPKECPWVFPSKAGAESGHVMDYKNQFDRLRKAAGLTNFTFHDLRRSFVAYMLMAKEPMPVVSAAAGHRSLDSMKPYARFAQGAINRALDSGDVEMERRMAEAEAEKAEEKRRLTA